MEFSGSEFGELLTRFDSWRKLLKYDEMCTCNISSIHNFIIELKTVGLLRCSAMNSQTVPQAIFLLSAMGFESPWRHCIYFCTEWNFFCLCLSQCPVALTSQKAWDWSMTQWCYLMKSLLKRPLQKTFLHRTWYTSKHILAHRCMPILQQKLDLNSLQMILITTSTLLFEIIRTASIGQSWQPRDWVFWESVLYQVKPEITLPWLPLWGVEEGNRGIKAEIK